jgi:hypothetical protein
VCDHERQEEVHERVLEVGVGEVRRRPDAQIATPVRDAQIDADGEAQEEAAAVASDLEVGCGRARERSFDDPGAVGERRTGEGSGPLPPELERGLRRAFRTRCGERRQRDFGSKGETPEEDLAPAIANCGPAPRRTRGRSGLA